MGARPYFSQPNPREAGERRKVPERRKAQSGEILLRKHFHFRKSDFSLSL